MATLLLPVATYAVTHSQPMSSSDWRQGSSQRRYRDTRDVRTWTLGLHGGPGSIAIAERAFSEGACGAAVWDWIPPKASDAIKVRFTSLGWSPETAVAGQVQAVVVECLSSDS